jgi:hypothetical protein
MVGAALNVQASTHTALLEGVEPDCKSLRLTAAAIIRRAIAAAWDMVAVQVGDE